MFNNSLIESVDTDEFNTKRPCPWVSLDGFLTPKAFEELYNSYPSINKFEKHKGIPRLNGQRPHDRWYLALEHSIYGDKKPGEKGCIALAELEKPWQEFISNLESNSQYKDMVRDLLKEDDFCLRFAWHVASGGHDVSPHIDDPSKAGTHIFYFNTDQDWNQSWGGQTLFFDGLKSDIENPGIEDFDVHIPAPNINNKSLLFRNTDNAWHGVYELANPEGTYRRLFNVIVQRPKIMKQRFSLKSRLKSIINSKLVADTSRR
jgi:hypothetical protein